MPNVIIDKKGQSDDEDEDAAEEKNDFLGQGDEGDDQLLQPPPASQSDIVNGEGEGDDDHGQFVQFVHYSRYKLPVLAHYQSIVALWQFISTHRDVFM